MMFESVSEQMTKQSFIIVVTWTLILFALFVWSLFFPGLIWGYLLAWLTGLIWFAITYQQTQKTIIRNNKEWKRTFDAVPDLLAILDNHQRILQCNKAMAETFGCSCSKMIGTKCYQIFHETDMPPSYCPFIPMLMDGKEHTKEIHLDKNNKDFLITTSPIYDEHGELDGCIHVARDITEHKQYETILHKFDFIVNSSEDFITLINKDYVYEAVSRSYHNVLNMNKNDIIGKRVVDVWGQDIFEKYIKEHLERCFAGNESISEGWFKFHTKGRGYYEVRYFPYFNENGEVTHVAVFSIDLTDRKQLEEAREEREELYRAMFEGNQAVKLLIDPSTGNIIDANPAASKFYGYPLDTLKTMKIFEINILSPDQIKKNMMAVKNKFSDYFHFQHRLANGEIRDVEVYSSPVEIHGKIMLYAIIHDITDRKHIEEAIEHRLLMEEIISIISNRFINVRSENIHIEIKAALQALAEFVRVERSYVSFLSDDERTVQQIYEWHQNNVTFGSELFEDKSFEWIMEKLRRFETICLFDAANTESEAANIEKNIRLAQSFKSLLIIPLILKKKLIGFLGFNSEYKEKVWTDEDISLLRLVGEIIVNARMRKQADEELRASEKFLSIQIKN